METFCKKKNIKHVLNAVASPRSNDQVERFNKTILSCLTAAIREDHALQETKIVEVESGINTCINLTTGRSPSELLYGFRRRLKYDIELTETYSDTNRLEQIKLNREKVLSNINKTADAMKRRYNKNRLAATKFKQSDLVLAKRSPIIKGLTNQWQVGSKIYWSRSNKIGTSK